MFSIWDWSGGGHLLVRNTTGPVLRKAPARIAICIFWSAFTVDILNSAQLLSIQSNISGSHKQMEPQHFY